MSDPLMAKKKDLLAVLEGMGFPKKYCYQVIANVDVSSQHATDLCFEWMEANPYKENQRKMVEKTKDELLDPLHKMGFSRDEATRGLAAAKNDLHRAIVWILASKTRQMKRAIEDEVVSLASRGVDISDADLDMTPDEDEPLQVSEKKAGPMSAAEQAADLKSLTKQIAELQSLVLQYQKRFLLLRKKGGSKKVAHKRSKSRGRASSMAVRPAKSSLSKSNYSSKAQRRKRKGSIGRAVPPPPPEAEPSRGRAATVAFYGKTSSVPLPPSPPEPSSQKRASSAPQPPPAPADDASSVSDSWAPAAPEAKKDQKKKKKKKKKKVATPKLAAPRRKSRGHQRKDSVPPPPPSYQPPEESSDEDVQPSVGNIKARGAAIGSGDFQFDPSKPSAAPDLEDSPHLSTRNSRGSHIRTPSTDWLQLAAGAAPPSSDEEEEDEQPGAAPAARTTSILSKSFDDQNGGPPLRRSRSAHASLDLTSHEDKLAELKKFAAAKKKVNLADRRLSSKTAMLELLQEQKNDNQVARGWVNDKGYRSLVIEVLEALELHPKIAKQFYCVVRVDSHGLKTPLRPVGTVESGWSEHFEFKLLSTTQNISVSIFDAEENGFAGKMTISMESLDKPVDKNWHKVQVLRESRFAKLRSRASRTCELQLRISCSLRDAEVSIEHTKVAEEQATSRIADVIRGVSSGSVRRYQEHGFDLDLSYIRDRIIAMAYPSAGVAALTSNHMSNVQRFFKSQHAQRYKVYNLAPGKRYPSSSFEGNVSYFPIEPYSPPPFQQLLPIVLDMHGWLTDHPQNVVSVHAKTGKHRTGLIICCYMIYAGLEKSVNAAVMRFNRARTTDSTGLVVPSQIRYIEYFQRQCNGFVVDAMGQKVADPLRRNIIAPKPPHLHLYSVRINDMPSDIKGSVKTWFVLRRATDKKWEYSSKKTVKPQRKNDTRTNAIVYSVPAGDLVDLHGDFKVEFWYAGAFTSKELMSLWVNTRFMGDDQSNGRVRVVIPKAGIDRAYKDTNHKVYPKKMTLELRFRIPKGQ